MAESASFFDDVEPADSLYRLPPDPLCDPVYAPPGAESAAAPEPGAAAQSGQAAPAGAAKA
ncbi:hypothetical protein NNJEOMEG_02758 [Fundidesulfovibrio magnetotacticus]|uniref:Uncharacterized protein n=1 Tax=Fundidesulfovibrio magnetotacticus TaxID=2730080 RepID=A0A6V8LVD6_9BACT|nr:hypothetical protein [Fundidesulfovibrio magnetotacticus]GFK94910.1 hypothetical protein NNJEOMEG_02758 [Fundidesulfovibrio magnetotacticus]